MTVSRQDTVYFPSFISCIGDLNFELGNEIILQKANEEKLAKNSHSLGIRMISFK